MAAASFSLTDDESETSEEVEECEGSFPGLGMRPPGIERPRMNSESQVSRMSLDEPSQAGASGGDAASGDRGGFRTRSQSAPPALWAAKKYGRQLRRMSDEFDVWLDRRAEEGGGPALRQVKSEGSVKQLCRSFWSRLWSHPETDGEHGDGHGNRNE